MGYNGIELNRIGGFKIDLELSKEAIYVFGHQHPDTDSICSAIAYANLKRKLGYTRANAYRLGDINKETAFALERFEIDVPKLLRDVNVRVEDLNMYKPATLKKNDPIKNAYDYLMSSESGARLLTVLNDDGTIAGIINQSDIAQMYIDSERDWKKLYAETPFSNLLDILKLKTVYGEYKYENIAGNLYIEEFDKNFSDKDVIITRADKRAKAAAEAAKNSEPGAAGAVVVVEKPLDEIVLLTRSAVSVSAIMKKGGIFKFAAENYIDDIVDFMKTSAHRNFPVVDKDDKFLGIISRRHLLDYRRKKVILVDHNENSQSVEGLNSAVILEIIDHHRIADVQTDSPVFVRAEPVGCTATIVYKMYKENDVPITRRIAGILLSAILSDTLMMRSPTATPEDRKAVDNLSIVAEVEINQYGREMFTAGTSLTGVTSAQILTNDLKIFTFGRYASSVSQFLTLDFESLQERNDELIKELENFRAEKKLDLAILMITDIVEGGSEIFVAASDPAKRFVADTFGVPSVDKSIFLEGVVSRKKQMVPKLTVAAQRI